MEAVQKSFAAIDFETANSQRSSVCSVGLVIVKNNQITDRFYRLIHPFPNFYSTWNTRVHGLRARDTAKAPPFPEVWAQAAPLIGDLPLTAHNSPFDEGCLKAVFAAYGMDYPNYRFYDTLRAARRIYGKMLPNHQLHTVARACGYDLTAHHHALADAEACAVIALKLIDFS